MKMNLKRRSAAQPLTDSKYFRLRSGALLSMIMLSLSTAQAFAVCQTPQFGNPVVLPVTRPVAIAPADYNRDGRIDLAVLKDVTGGTFRGVVEIYLGNGSGGFASTGVQYSAVQTNDYDIASGDFNNDGFLDLAVSGGPSSQYFVAVLPFFMRNQKMFESPYLI